MQMKMETIGNFNSTIKRLEKLAKKDFNPTLSKIGDLGVRNLSANTPVGETGETAAGWKKVVKDKEVFWANNAHPQERVNIAKIIQLGHGTGTGGYVPPTDYMTPSMDVTFLQANELIKKELTD